MPRVGSEQYVALEHTSATSTTSGDTKTMQPTNGRAVAVFLTVEGAFAARVTFDGTNPGSAAPPGLLIPTATPPLMYPLPITPGLQGGPKIKFSSNGAGNSILSVLWLI